LVFSLTRSGTPGKSSWNPWVPRNRSWKSLLYRQMSKLNSYITTRTGLYIATQHRQRYYY